MENFVDAGSKAGEVGWTVEALDIEVNIERWKWSSKIEVQSPIVFISIHLNLTIVDTELR